MITNNNLLLFKDTKVIQNQTQSHFTIKKRRIFLRQITTLLNISTLSFPQTSKSFYAMKKQITPLLFLSLFVFGAFLFTNFSGKKTIPIQKDYTEQPETPDQNPKFAEQEFMMLRDPATNTIPKERLFEAHRIAEIKRSAMQSRNALPIQKRLI